MSTPEEPSTTAKSSVERPNAPHLPAELWVKIIAHLRCPMPRPNGKARRSEIRQNDLACMMRVCKTFNNITGILLYSTIITDHLASLIRNIRSPPAAEGVPSKRDLLSHGKRLFLEYADKAEPDYATLMRHGGVYFGLLSPSQEDTIRFCGAEADWIKQSAELLEGVVVNCKTLSTGAYLGGQQDIWNVLEKFATRHRYNERNLKENQLYKRVMEARVAMSDKIVPAAAGPSAFCQRVEYGPLTFRPILWTSPERPLCVHADMELGDCPGVVGGAGTISRWYLTLSEAKHLEDAAMTILHTIDEHIVYREGYRKRGTEADAKELDATHFAVDFYVPDDLMGDPADMSRWISVIGQRAATTARLRLPFSRTEKDDWVLKPLSSAPACAACDWCAEDYEPPTRDPDPIE